MGVGLIDPTQVADTIHATDAGVQAFRGSMGRETLAEAKRFGRHRRR